MTNAHASIHAHPVSFSKGGWRDQFLSGDRWASEFVSHARNNHTAHEINLCWSNAAKEIHGVLAQTKSQAGYPRVTNALRIMVRIVNAWDPTTSPVNQKPNAILPWQPTPPAHQNQSNEQIMLRRSAPQSRYPKSHTKPISKKPRQTDIQKAPPGRYPKSPPNLYIQKAPLN